jgi:hypothetical protein
MLKQRITDIGYDLLAKPHDVIETNGGTHRQKQDNGDHHGKILVHQVGI